MAPVIAQIAPQTDDKEQRARTRRALRLEVRAHLSEGATEALIHNVSQHGLLIETSAALSVGDMFLVELPEAGDTETRVVWARGRFLGCRFSHPVAQAAISASLLRSPAAAPAAAERPLSTREREEQELLYPDSSPALVLISLLVALGVALAFVVALYSFPFSTG